MAKDPKINPPLVLWFATAFVCGFVVLSLEMLGFRLLAPYFGYSTYVWGGLLGVIMAALSAGYYFGGALADRRPETALLFRLILCATLYLMFILAFYKSLLGLLTGIGIIPGSILGATLLFGPAMTVLGMVSPFLIRLLAHENDIGLSAGKIFAISTWGSLLGTFLTSFVLIPEFGSFKTLAGCVVALLLLYIAGVLHDKSGAALGAGLIALTLFLPGRQSESGVIYETESPYNLIQVKRRNGQVGLHLNGGDWVHSRYTKGYLSTGAYYDFMLLATLLTDCRNVAILGGGAGTSIRQFLHFAPRANVDAVEIDPEIFEAGRRFFELKDDPRLRLFVEDARPFLARTRESYDVIEVDMFAGGPFMPFYLSTQEFFQSVAERLRPGGWMMMNVFTVGGNRVFSDSLGATVKTVFPSLFVVDLGDNLVFMASKEAVSLDAVRARLEAGRSRFGAVAPFALEHLAEAVSPPGAMVFTDDRAPTEKMIYDMVREKYLR